MVQSRRALVSHQCVPGSIPRLCVICGLSLLLVLFLAPRGFSPGTPLFPSPQKQTFPNSNSIWIIVKHFIMSLWFGWLRRHSLCLPLNLHLHFSHHPVKRGSFGPYIRWSNCCQLLLTVLITSCIAELLVSSITVEIL